MGLVDRGWRYCLVRKNRIRTFSQMEGFGLGCRERISRSHSMNMVLLFSVGCGCVVVAVGA